TRVFFFQAEDGIRDRNVTGVQTCALPISGNDASRRVSEKLGYSPNGHRRLISQDGAPRTEHQLVLFAADYEHTDDEVIVTGAEAVRRFLGLEQDPTVAQRS